MNPIALTRGDTVTLSYQLKEDGLEKDITGMTFKLAVKEGITDASYKINPVSGTIDDAATGKFSFELTESETDQSPFAGVMEIAMYDASSNKTTLTGAGGIAFRLVEDIV